MTARGATGPAVLAVDGGNSKVDVAILAADGTLLGAVRGPTISHQAVGLDEGVRRFGSTVQQARIAAGLQPGTRIPTAIACLAGADYPEDVRALSRTLGAVGAADELEILNDTFAALRAGASRPWGIALICGQGINGAAVGVDGRRVRFAGVGDISGDWGGASSVGMAGLGAAVRARDGRGPRTALERAIPAAVGLRRPEDVTRAYYAGRLDEVRVGILAPSVFGTAAAGDAVARGIVNRLADELVVMATALGRRAHLVRRDPDVVCGGSVFRTDDTAFHDRIRAGISAAIQDARVVRLGSPPVLGAALIALDRLGPNGAAPPAVAELARSGIDAWDATARVVTAS
jgi:N-acetylglucosamine kinase-like BadF-type ATPase